MGHSDKTPIRCKILHSYLCFRLTISSFLFINLRVENAKSLIQPLVALVVGRGCWFKLVIGGPFNTSPVVLKRPP